MAVDVFMDGSTDVAKTINVTAGEAASVYGTAVYGTGTYSSTSVVRAADDVDRYAEQIQFQIRNATASQFWAIAALILRYSYGTEEI